MTGPAVEQDETAAGLGGEHPESAVAVQLRKKRERRRAGLPVHYRQTIVVAPAPPPRVEAALRGREEEIGRHACRLLLLVV